MTPENIKSLKVVELKDELSNRGLSTTGLKKDLVARLIKAFKEEKKLIEPEKDKHEKKDKVEQSEATEVNIPNFGEHQAVSKKYQMKKDHVNKKDKIQAKENIAKNRETSNAERLPTSDFETFSSDVSVSSDKEMSEKWDEDVYIEDQPSSSPIEVHVTFEEEPKRDGSILQDSIDQQSERVEEDQTSQANDLINEPAANEKENLYTESTASLLSSVDERNPLSTIYESPAILGTDYQFIYERCLSISRLLPPFSATQLEALLERFGVIEDFYLNFAKSQAFVRYESEEMARDALGQLRNMRWPESFGELLFVTSIPLEEALNVIETESKIIGFSTQKGFVRKIKRAFEDIEIDIIDTLQNNSKNKKMNFKQ